MSADSRVMLAPNEEVPLEEIRFPMLGSFKMDGYRVCSHNGFLRSRTWKLESTALHLRFRQMLQSAKASGFVVDGELWSREFDFSTLASKASAGTEVELHESIKYYVFDLVPQHLWGQKWNRRFQERYDLYRTWLTDLKFPYIEVVEQRLVHSVAQAREMLAEAIEKNFEGLMLKCPNSHYKHGRATVREHTTFKVKMFTTVDAQIIGFEQGTRMKESVKRGERTRDERGYLERTAKAETRELVNEIGAFKVRLRDGTTCKVNISKEGAEIRKLIRWDNRMEFIGKWVEFRYQEHGTKDRPRFGRIVRMRPDLDE